MKTTSTFPLQYSGYPLQTIETKEKAKAPLQEANKEKEKTIVLATSASKSINDPSSWDESWFSNYE